MTSKGDNRRKKAREGGICRQNKGMIPPQLLLFLIWRIPAQERGRVFSFQATLFNAGSIPILLFAGVIGDTLGIDTVMYLLAAAILGFSWWTAWYSHRAKKVKE